MRYILAAIAMLLVWGIAITMFHAPGWIHILLSGGVALWVYGIVGPQTPAKR